MNHIPIIKSYLPPKEKLFAYIEKIYANRTLTNHGPLVQLLTERLSAYLGVKNLILVSSGAFALQLAYKLMDLSGEVITTPFSFCATSSTLIWAGLKPKFADIHPQTFNIDPANIEQHIHSHVSAILPVHVFGNPCEVGQLQHIAHQYCLKLIYDAAHCFGASHLGKSLLSYGDVSIISFHATKIFHTVEGGALVIKDDSLYEKAKHLINFGINSSNQIVDVGINGKLSEFHAAMGLCILEDIDHIIAERQENMRLYQQILAPHIQLQAWQGEDTPYNYFPVLFESEKQCLTVLNHLKDNHILTRRYFYPALHAVPSYTDKYIANCPNAVDIAKRILCLPLYHDLSAEHLKKICHLILKSMEHTTLSAIPA